MRLRREVIAEAMKKTECTSIDELGWKFLGKSGTTLRNYRDGKSVPAIGTLMILRRITRIPLDDMIADDDILAAA